MSARSTPNQWKMVKLGEVTEIMKGGTPSRNVERYFRGGIPWAIPSDITALDSALYINDTATHISEEALGKSAAKLLPAGTVLLTSRATIGETVIATVPMATNQGFANFICHETLLNVFLTYYLRYIKEKLNDLASGSTFKEITKGTLLNIEIPLPPLSEQRAIAEVLSDVDGLLNALEALIAKKRAIKQATMQQLLTGKTRLPGFSGEWETKRFEDIFKRLNGNPHKIQNSEYSVNGPYPVIDQGQDTVVGYSDQTEKLFKCPAGGVIVFGDHTRIVKFVDVDFLIGADGTQLLAMKGNDVTKFLYYQLSTKDIPNTGYNRHFKFLKDLTFKIPRSEEQRAIASVLSDIDAEIAALEQRRDKTRAIKQGMMQQLLTGRVRLSESRIGTDYADYAD